MSGNPCLRERREGIPPMSKKRAWGLEFADTDKSAVFVGTFLTKVAISRVKTCFRGNIADIKGVSKAFGLMYEAQKAEITLKTESVGKTVSLFVRTCTYPPRTVPPPKKRKIDSNLFFRHPMLDPL